MTDRLYFDQAAWETVEAAMARIIPSDDGPGAREAAAVRFLDRYLSGTTYVYARPDGSGFQPLSGRTAAAWEQRIDALRRQYEDGLRDLDRRSREAFGEDFRRLAPERQDEVLAAVERAGAGDAEAVQAARATAGYGGLETPGLQEPATEEGLDFFQLLVLHTRQGFYADPVYGGNRDHVGWRHLGFPGPVSLAEAHAGEHDTLPYFAEGDGR